MCSDVEFLEIIKYGTVLVCHISLSNLFWSWNNFKSFVSIEFIDAIWIVNLVHIEIAPNTTWLKSTFRVFAFLVLEFITISMILYKIDNMYRNIQLVLENLDLCKLTY